jgi:4'-phosphopantetheinyl transferase
MIANSTANKEICYNEYGKPYIAGGCRFNISHSGAVVAAAFSRHEIGLDIELVKKRKNIELIAKRFFCQNEYEFIINNADPTESFYYVWTRKEAFLKALGTGLYEKINLHNCLNDEISYREKSWYIKSFFLKEGYAAACCAETPLSILKIAELRYDDFEGFEGLF